VTKLCNARRGAPSSSRPIGYLAHHAHPRGTATIARRATQSPTAPTTPITVVRDGLVQPEEVLEGFVALLRVAAGFGEVEGAGGVEGLAGMAGQLSVQQDGVGELLRVFRTGNLRLIHAASCPFRNWSMTSCGVR
jgi:hypothetical protein